MILAAARVHRRELELRHGRLSGDYGSEKGLTGKDGRLHPGRVSRCGVERNGISADAAEDAGSLF